MAKKGGNRYKQIDPSQAEGYFGGNTSGGLRGLFGGIPQGTFTQPSVSGGGKMRGAGNAPRLPTSGFDNRMFGSFERMPPRMPFLQQQYAGLNQGVMPFQPLGIRGYTPQLPPVYGGPVYGGFGSGYNQGVFNPFSYNAFGSNPFNNQTVQRSQPVQPQLPPTGGGMGGRVGESLYDYFGDIGDMGFERNYMNNIPDTPYIPEVPSRIQERIMPDTGRELTPIMPTTPMRTQVVEGGADIKVPFTSPIDTPINIPTTPINPLASQTMPMNQMSLGNIGGMAAKSGGGLVKGYDNGGTVERELGRFTPSVSEGFWDMNPEMGVDLLKEFIPFIESTPKEDARIRSEIKPEHVEELADYLLKGGNFQWRNLSRADKRKTYQDTENPLIKETIMHGPDMIAHRILRNNFYGLDLNDRKLISESYINLLNRTGTKDVKESEYSDETRERLNKLKDARKKFKDGDISQSEFDALQGSLTRSLQEENVRSASRSLFADIDRLPHTFRQSPYQGRGEETIEAARSADYSPFVQSMDTDGPMTYDWRERLYGGKESRQALANLQAQYGFEPQLDPWNADAPVIGQDRKYYDPTEVFEYHDVEDLEEALRGPLSVQRYMEGDDYPLEGKREDRGRIGEGQLTAKVFTGYRGPEGTYYDADKHQFYRDTPIYGEPTFVPNRYKYDPRFIELLESIRGPEYAKQFMKTGGIIKRGFAEGGMPEESQTAERLEEETIMALMGKHPNPKEVYIRYIEVYGEEGLIALAAEVEQMMASQGRMVEGEGGGVDDAVPAMIDGVQPAALSKDEYVIPADVVAHAGDGSSEAGGRKFDELVSRVRKNKTGNTEQPEQIEFEEEITRVI